MPSRPAAPPSGAVTFLFTDIEGSTRLWEHQPDAMRAALARHDDLLRRSIEAHGGWVFKTVGDAFCAAFAAAPDALEAALSAQLALSAEPWPTDAPLRARMALHTGGAEERDGDYFGPPLNRIARLLSAGHGGQTLLSRSAREMARGGLPEGAGLRDLGERRLKDMSRPDHVFQLEHPDLPADFPPLKSLDNPDLPNNLPQQMTSFVGRETQVAQIKDLLTRTRLLTLTGAGGAGKTRLALQVAADLLDQYFDGVWLVELAPLSDPSLVAQAAAGALGVREQPGRTVGQSLTEWLRPRRLLLVLDNCEHLVGSCADLAAGLLRHCPGVRVLATSREPLVVPGEQLYRVPGLLLPDPEAAPTAHSLSGSESASLFVERARAVRPDFALSDAGAPAVAQVCRRLDGIPLAIELAAARVRSLPVEEVSARLDNRFRLLTGGSRTLLPRQQTLRALIDWSYDLLTEPEKTLLARLSVFAGGWTLVAAEAICAGDGVEDWEVLDLATGLSDKSLVAYEEGEGGGRYRLLETVRQYAADRLAEADGGGAETRARHARWCLAVAEEAAPQLRGPDQAEWLSRLEAEHDNLRAALAWWEAASAPGAPESSPHEAAGWLRLCVALSGFWGKRGFYAEGRDWLGRALARPESGDVAPVRGRALHAAGDTAFWQGDFDGAAALFAEGLERARREADPPGAARCLLGLGNSVFRRGDPTGARARYEEGLDLLREGSEPWVAATLLNSLANVHYVQGDLAGARARWQESLALRRRIGDLSGAAVTQMNLSGLAIAEGDLAGARPLLEESLDMKRRLGDRGGVALCLSNLGTLTRIQGDYAASQAFLEQSVEQFRRIGDPQGAAAALWNLGAVALAQGDPDRARALHVQSLETRRQIGEAHGVGESLAGLARVAAAQGRPARSLRLWGAFEALRERIGESMPPEERASFEDEIAAVRVALPADRTARAWDEGRTLTQDEAADYALGDAD